MSPSGYTAAVLEYVQARGWTTNLTELREGAYIVAGNREAGSGSERMLLMIVCEPEENLTQKHVEYLLKAARKKEVDTTVVTARVPPTDEAKQTVEQYGVSIINPDTVLKKDGPQSDTATGQSHAEDPTQESTYEVYGSRARLLLFGIGSLVLGFGAVGLLITGAGNWFVTIVAVIGVPSAFFGGAVLFYQAIIHDPVLRITDDGIYYNKPVVASEFYPWSNVEQISRAEQEVGKRTLIISTQVHLQIQVSERDDDSTASQISNDINKSLLDDEADAHYIPMSTFGIEFAEVAEAVNRYSDVPITGEI